MKERNSMANVDHSPKPGSGATLAIPPDDIHRKLSVVDPDDPKLRHVAVVGDTYTILLSGAETAGRYCLIDMSIPHCGGPGPHRHNFEEMFSILEGEIEFTFRGEKTVVKAGMTVNIPANAPHFFTNTGGHARMLCMCTPAGQEDFFVAIGSAVAGRTTAAPVLTKEQQAAFVKKAQAIAPKYQTELLVPEKT
jgi:quercetin dioxygenase-like cupin family protein